MKKLLNISTFLCVSFVGFAQGWIGSTESEIRKGLPNLKYSVEINRSGQRFLMAVDELEHSHFAFFFDPQTKLCRVYRMLTPSFAVLNTIIERMDEVYIRVSDRHWKSYDRGKFLHIRLHYDKEVDLSYFEYTAD